VLLFNVQCANIPGIGKRSNTGFICKGVTPRSILLKIQFLCLTFMAASALK